MNFFKALFYKEKRQKIPPMPSWSEIVEMMFDKKLDAFSDEVICVIYSVDKSMRYVVLKSEKGHFTYQLEAIYKYDEDEWIYNRSQNDVLPAMWEPFRGVVSKSFFESEEELLKEMKEEPEYKQYFE